MPPDTSLNTKDLLLPPRHQVINGGPLVDLQSDCEIVPIVNVPTHLWMGHCPDNYMEMDSLMHSGDPLIDGAKFHDVVYTEVYVSYIRNWSES